MVLTVPIPPDGPEREGTHVRRNLTPCGTSFSHQGGVSREGRDLEVDIRTSRIRTLDPRSLGGRVL